MYARGDVPPRRKGDTRQMAQQSYGLDSTDIQADTDVGPDEYDGRAEGHDDFKEVSK